MAMYKVVFYLDIEKIEIEHIGIFIAENETEAKEKARQEFKPQNLEFYSIILWEPFDSNN